jgi:anti-anti-sigma factor
VNDIRNLDRPVGERNEHVPFTVEIRPDRERVIVVPHGELDLATVELLRAEFDALASRGFPTIVLDLRRLLFLDSTGLRFILEQTGRAEPAVTLIDGVPAVSKLFDLTGTRPSLPFEVSR